MQRAESLRLQLIRQLVIQRIGRVALSTKAGPPASQHLHRHETKLPHPARSCRRGHPQWDRCRPGQSITAQPANGRATETRGVRTTPRKRA